MKIKNKVFIIILNMVSNIEVDEFMFKNLIKKKKMKQLKDVF